MLPPNAKLQRLVDAASEPLGLADAKNYLRVEVADDDALIGDLITAARLECEKLVDRSFIATTWRLTLDYLPFAGGGLGTFALPWGRYGRSSFGRAESDDGSIQLPMPPLIGVTAFSYLDQGGVSRDLDLASRVIVSPGTPGRVYPAYGTFYPLAQPRPAAVTIAYTAGYGPDASSVPKVVVQAIRMLTAFYYESRSSDAEPPRAVANLLDSVRWGSYA